MDKIKILATWWTIFSEENWISRYTWEDTNEQQERVKKTLNELADLDTEEIYNIDSSDLRPENIKMIAKKIIKTEQLDSNKYKWYLITHGTDTMAYTAAILSYLLQGIQKSVILTGSMIPIKQKWSDAPNNLINSTKAILSNWLNWVYISFWDKIIRWSKVKKMDTNDLSTFDSPNGEIDWYFKKQEGLDKTLKLLNKNSVTNTTSQNLFENFSNDVQTLKLTPTTDLSIFDYYIKAWVKWIILEWYWDGNLPWEDEKSEFAKWFQSKIGQCLDEWITIVLKSQCPYWTADHKYKWAQLLLDKWVLSAKNMTSESAQAKLMRVLWNYKDKKEIKNIYEKDLVWEFK